MIMIINHDNEHGKDEYDHDDHNIHVYNYHDCDDNHNEDYYDHENIGHTDRHEAGMIMMMFMNMMKMIMKIMLMSMIRLK